MLEMLFQVQNLKEAGKIALNLTKGGSSIKRLQVASRKGASRKVITIRTDQLQSKLSNPNSNNITSRSTNILKKSAVDKAAKLLVSNTSTISTVAEIKNSVSIKEKVASSPAKIVESIIL
ncbi:hypothetical protein PUN28_009780 [Cardiocondyla obscurior]|uniref:Uncharacterized protein n=1 Tax=Cardiocondyla obscurior TaxID=286306 RepID=A0AAW2FQJ4_9HYME